MAIVFYTRWSFIDHTGCLSIVYTDLKKYQKFLGQSYRFDCPHHQGTLHSCISVEGVAHYPDLVFSVCLTTNNLSRHWISWHGESPLLETSHEDCHDVREPHHDRTFNAWIGGWESGILRTQDQQNEQRLLQKYKNVRFLDDEDNQTYRIVPETFDIFSSQCER